MSRIMIADDDETVRNMLARFLSRQGHEVVTAETGREAVEKARGAPPDVILMDVNMPEMDGVEACRLLKNEPGTASVPILMLSGQSDRASRIRGIAAGANDYLAKPVDMEELDLRVRNALKMKSLYDQLQAKYAELAAMKELRDDITQMLIADNQRLEAVVAARDKVRSAARDVASQ
jgi:DNA-binding response OmpR family regulator